MDTLRSLFPKAETLLALESEDLAPVLLRLARQRGGAMFWPEGVTQEPMITGEPNDGYPYYKKTAVDALINEAWNCLRRDALIIPAPGINGA